MSATMWKFDERHVTNTAVPRRTDGDGMMPEEGVVLACTLQNACAASGRVCPPDYSSGNARRDAECTLFNEYWEMLIRLHLGGMVDALYVEEIVNERCDAIMAHRLVASVSKSSPRLMDAALLENEEEGDGNDGDVEMGGEVDGRGRGHANEQYWSRVRSSIEGALRSVFYVGEAMEEGKGGSGGGKGGKGGKKRKRSSAYEDHQRVYRLFQALKRNMLEVEGIDEGFNGASYDGGGTAFPAEPRATDLCGRVDRETKVLENSLFGAIEVFSLIACLCRDEVVRGERRFDLEQEDGCGDRVFDFCHRGQCEIANYFKVDDDVNEVCEFEGVAFPRITNGSVTPLVTRVSVTHLRTGALALLPPPRRQFEAFLWRHQQSASADDAVQLSSRNLRLTNCRRGLRQALNPMLSRETGSAGAVVTVRSKPSEYYDAAALEEGFGSSNSVSPTDPVVVKQHSFLENPRDIAEELSIGDADVERFRECERALQHLCEQLNAEWDTLSEADQEARRSSVAAKRRQTESLACVAAEKALSRAVQAARAKDWSHLSEAQVACFAHAPGVLTRMTPHVILQRCEENLSPFANWMQDLTVGFDEVFGVHTHHTQALFLMAATKTGFMAADVMRNHTVQSGAAEAGKDFLRETVEYLFPKGIFQAKSFTTEAARVDTERLLETGMVFFFSETPAWLLESKSAEKQLESGQEWLKKMLTELCVNRTRYVEFMTSMLESVKFVTRIRVRARGVLIVNSNHDGSEKSESHGHQAVLSRFTRLQQSIPSRKWGSITDGAKTATGIDARLYTNAGSESGVPLKMAREQMQIRCHHNVRFHCTFGFLRTLGVVSDVNMHAFDCTKGRVVRIMKKYYGVVVMSRYAQQARNFAYVLSLDEWWVRQFMLPNGFFVDGSARSIGDDDVVTAEQITRGLYRCPPACTEEIMLYAWQLMMTTGVVSHGILASVAKLFVNYMRNQARVDKSMNAVSGGDDRFKRFVNPNKFEYSDLIGTTYMGYVFWALQKAVLARADIIIDSSGRRSGGRRPIARVL